MFSPQTGFVFLVYEITRHIAIAMQQVIVDISQKNASFNLTSLVSMVPSFNKVSSSSRGFFLANVTAHAGKIAVFLLFILFITRLLGDYWFHYNFVTGQIDTNKKKISSTGSVGRTSNYKLC
jgi:hypothetical protein